MVCPAGVHLAAAGQEDVAVGDVARDLRHPLRVVLVCHRSAQRVKARVTAHIVRQLQGCAPDEDDDDDHAKGFIGACRALH